jgi:hypothetical protein
VPLSFSQIKLLQTLVELVYVGYWLVHDGFPIVAAKLDREVLLFCGVEEGTNLTFVAAELVTADSLILVWVVKSLHGGVTLRALQAPWAMVPRDAFR